MPMLSKEEQKENLFLSQRQDDEGLLETKQLRKKLERIRALEKKSELTDVMQAEIILIEYILGTRNNF